MRSPATRILLVLAGLAAVVCVSGVSWGLLQLAQAAPTLTTDKYEYFYAETVTITGGGFAPNTFYDIPVIRPDSSIVIGDGSETAGWDNVKTDGSGGFTYYYILNGIEGTYTVEVYAWPWGGPGSGDTLVASSTFIDGKNDFTQCLNDSDNNQVIDDCEWSTGAINQNNSFYTEGNSVPQRLFHELGEAGTYTMGFTYQFSQKQNAVYAYDFVANVDDTMAAGPSELNECDDLPGPISEAICQSLFSGPDANTADVDIPSDPFDAVSSRENPPGAGARDFRVGCDPACTSISASLVFPSLDGSDDLGEAHLPDSDPDCYQNCDTTDVQIELTFTTSEADTLAGVWFGGHLGEATDPPGSAIGWGTGFGASGISGAPFHIKYVCLVEPGDSGPCGSPSTAIGNRDNQIQFVFQPTPTPVPPTATSTDTPTPVPPTATSTDTPTPVPPTATSTDTPTPVPPTATSTDTPTPVPPTPTSTRTATPVPPTPTSTRTATPVAPTATYTPVPTETPPPGVGGTVKLPPAAIAAESVALSEDSNRPLTAYATLAGVMAVAAAGLILRLAVLRTKSD